MCLDAGAYPEGAVVRYQSVLYIAREDLDSSTVIPPLNPDEWEEISTTAVKSPLSRTI